MQMACASASASIAAGNDKPYELDLERMKHWVGLGAQMSEKVADLYKQASKSV